MAQNQVLKLITLAHLRKQNLVAFLKPGYGKNVMSIAQSVAADKSVFKILLQRVGGGVFLKRNPDLSLCRGDINAHIRMNAVNRDSIFYSSMRLLLSTTSIQSLPRYIM